MLLYSKRLVYITVKTFLLSCVSIFIFVQPNYAQSQNQSKTTVIQGGVYMSSKVPAGFFGSWKVYSVRLKTTDTQEFGPYGIDIWNLSKSGDVITLSNPVSGASASVLVNEVNGNTVKFKKFSSEKDEESVETPVLTLEDDNFYGIDKIDVKKYKNGRLYRHDTVEYKVKAVKVSGATIPDLFGQ